MTSRPAFREPLWTQVTCSLQRGAGTVLLVAGASCLASCLCPCDAPPGTPINILGPAANATDIPVDTLVWVGARQIEDAETDAGIFGKAPPALMLVGPDGPVPGNTSTILPGGQNQGAIMIFHPAALLAASTQFEVLSNSAHVSSFLTGPDPSGPPPALPIVNETSFHSSPYTCSYEENEFSADAPGFLLLLQEEGQESALDVAALSGQVNFVGPTSSQNLIILDTGCRPPARTTQLRFGTLNLNGAFSGWTDWFVSPPA